MKQGLGAWASLGLIPGLGPKKVKLKKTRWVLGSRRRMWSWLGADSCEEESCDFSAGQGGAGVPPTCQQSGGAVPRGPRFFPSSPCKVQTQQNVPPAHSWSDLWAGCPDAPHQKTRRWGGPLRGRGPGCPDAPHQKSRRWGGSQREPGPGMQTSVSTRCCHPLRTHSPERPHVDSEGPLPEKPGPWGQRGPRGHGNRETGYPTVTER